MSVPFQQSTNHLNTPNRPVYVNTRVENGVIKNGRMFSNALPAVLGHHFAGCTITDQTIVNGDFYDCTFVNTVVQAIVKRLGLMPHQEELLREILRWIQSDEARAQAICSVAYGKTHMVPHILTEVADLKGYTTLGLAFPSRALAGQTMTRFFKSLNDILGANHNIMAFLFHSGAISDDLASNPNLVKCEAGSMDELAIVSQYHQWISAGYRVVFATLYQSAEKVFAMLKRNGITIQFAVFDEAHNLSRNSQMFNLVGTINDPVKVHELDLLTKARLTLQATYKDIRKDDTYKKQFSDIIKKREEIIQSKPSPIVPKDIPVERILFTTATPTSLAARLNRSMDNEEIFGKVIYTFSFLELAKLGLVINPEITPIQADIDMLSTYLKNVGIQGTTLTQVLPDITNFATIAAMLHDAKGKFGNDPIKCIISVSSVADIEALSGEIHNLADHKKRLNPTQYEQDIGTSAKILQQLAKHITGYDFDVTSVSGDTPIKDKIDRTTGEVTFGRETRFAEFERSRHSLFINCEVLAEGVNFPEANCALLLRSADVLEAPQMMGRIVRLSRFDQDRITNGTLAPDTSLAGYTKTKAIFYVATTFSTVQSKISQTNLVLDTLRDYRDGEFTEAKSLGVWDQSDLNEHAVKDENGLAQSAELYDTLLDGLSKDDQDWFRNEVFNISPIDGRHNVKVTEASTKKMTGF